MKHATRLATLTLVAATFTGCGLIKVKGLNNSSNGSSATSSAPPSGGGAGKEATFPAGTPMKGSPTDEGAYQKISYERFVGTYDLDGDYAFREVGGSAYHPEKGGNPDPTWILRWEAPMSQDEAKTIVAQAAINRTWLARAEQDFATWWPKIEALASAQAAAIAKIEAGPGNHYERTIALRNLYAETNKAAAAVELADHPLLQFQVANSVAKSNTAAGVGFATRRFLLAIKATTAFPNVGRAIGSKDKERELFLLAAANGELARTTGTPKLPMTSQNAKTRTAIKWPLTPAQETKLREELKNNQPVVAAWTAEPPKTESFQSSEAMGLVWIDGEGPDNVVDGYTSIKVTNVGSGKLTLTGYKRRSVPYNCKTGVVTSLDGGKSIGQNCSYKSDDTKIVIALKASETPVKIQVGDVLQFYGTRTAQQQKDKTISAEIDALYITKVVRKGTVLFTE